MTAGENEPEPLIRNFRPVVIGLNRAVALCGNGFHRFGVAYPAANFIDCLVASRLDNPGARRLRNSLQPPLVDGCCKSLLRRFLGEFEIPELCDEGGNNPAPLGPIDLVDGFVRLLKHKRSNLFSAIVDLSRLRSTSLT